MDSNMINNAPYTTYEPDHVKKELDNDNDKKHEKEKIEPEQAPDYDAFGLDLREEVIAKSSYMLFFGELRKKYPEFLWCLRMIPLVYKSKGMKENSEDNVNIVCVGQKIDPLEVRKAADPEGALMKVLALSEPLFIAGLTVKHAYTLLKGQASFQEMAQALSNKNGDQLPYPCVVTPRLGVAPFMQPGQPDRTTILDYVEQSLGESPICPYKCRAKRESERFYTEKLFNVHDVLNCMKEQRKHVVNEDQALMGHVATPEECRAIIEKWLDGVLANVNQKSEHEKAQTGLTEEQKRLMTQMVQQAKRPRVA